jgi:hypothetical protein
MATAEAERSSPRTSLRPSWRWAGPVLAIGIAVAVGLWAARGTGEPAVDTAATAPPVTVVIDASSPTVAPSLTELTAASDLVVRGTVVSTAQGRLVGGGDPADPAGSAVLSRVATVRVDEVLGGAGPAPAIGATILVEEEGWLTDGRVISVNGAPPTATGDEVVWFLQSVQDAELTGFVGVGTQGRFLLRPGGVVVGPDRDDPLAMTVERLGADALLSRLRAGAP